MMLSMDVLRWVTVQALRNRTWAMGRVFDSPGQPADLRMESERAPFIAVYTDDADFDLTEGDGAGMAGFYVSDGDVWLVIEIAVGGQGLDNPDADSIPEQDRDPAMQRTAKDEGTIVATDQGLEARIGFISRQVIDALNDPLNPWGELWRQMVMDRKRIQVRRGGSGDEQKEINAQRFASRVLRLQLGIIGEPAPGEPLGEGFWSDLLALSDTDDDADMKGIADIIRRHIEGPDSPDAGWRLQQRILGITERGVRSIGIGPATAESQETPPLTSVEVESNG